MKFTIKQLVRKVFNSLGLDIVRVANSPKRNLLGLQHLPIRSIIDVGANIGQFARMISNVFPEAHIYSFEPLPEPFKQLKELAYRLNGRATVYNVALGDEEGDVEMLSHLYHSPSSSFLKSTNVSETLYPFIKKQAPVAVKLMTLDGMLANLSEPLPLDILIKLDVQGYEDRVIQGAIETFHKARACILEVCLDKLYEDQATFKRLFLALDGLGYHYAGNLNQVYAEDGHVIYIDAVFMK